MLNRVAFILTEIFVGRIKNNGITRNHYAVKFVGANDICPNINRLNRTFNLNHFEYLDLVADFYIIVVFHADTTFHTVTDF